MTLAEARALNPGAYLSTPAGRGCLTKPVARKVFVSVMEPGKDGFPKAVERSFAPEDVEPAEPVADIAPPLNLVCFSCWGSDYWTSRAKMVCRRCHPPAPGVERERMAA